MNCSQRCCYNSKSFFFWMNTTSFVFNCSQLLSFNINYYVDLENPYLIGLALKQLYDTIYQFSVFGGRSADLRKNSDIHILSDSEATLTSIQPWPLLENVESNRSLCSVENSYHLYSKWKLSGNRDSFRLMINWMQHIIFIWILVAATKIALFSKSRNNNSNIDYPDIVSLNEIWPFENGN